MAKSQLYLVMILLGVSTYFVMEYAITLPHGSTTIDTCGQLAPPTIAWRIAEPRSEESMANTIFHVHRLQPTCEEARRAQIGAFAVGLGLLAMAVISELVSGRTIFWPLGLLSAVGAIYFVGSAWADGPVFPAIALGLGAAGTAWICLVRAASPRGVAPSKLPRASFDGD